MPLPPDEFPSDWEGDDYFDGDANTDAFAEDEETFKILNQIGSEFGISDFGDIVILFGQVKKNDISQLRAQRFSTPEEASIFLYGIGVFSFADIVKMGDGTYGVLIPATTPIGGDDEIDDAGSDE